MYVSDVGYTNLNSEIETRRMLTGTEVWRVCDKGKWWVNGTKFEIRKKYFEICYKTIIIYCLFQNELNFKSLNMKIVHNSDNKYDN